MYPKNHLVGKSYDGKVAQAGSLVRDGAWLGQAIRATIESPAPVETGDTFDTYQGVAAIGVAINASSVIWGQTYKPAKGWLSSGFYLRTVIGNAYTVYIERGGSLSQILKIENAKISGDTFYPYKLIIPAGKEIKLAVLERQAEPITTDVVASYNYSPYNENAPSSGQITQSNYPFEILRVHVTDNDGIDRSSLISGLGVGDIISNGQRDWSIQSVRDEGDPSYYTFVVSPPNAADIQGIQDITFSTAQVSLITYSVEDNYWLSNYNGQIKGFFGVDTSLDGVTENDNAYRINLVAVEAYLSDDFVILGYSAELGF